MNYSAFTLLKPFFSGFPKNCPNPYGNLKNWCFGIFLSCFRRLIYCVQYSVCPHSFIQENNIFENRIVGRAREELSDKIVTLERYGWRCIIFSGKLGNKPGQALFYDLLCWSFINFQLMRADIIAAAALSPDYFNLSQNW